MQSASSGAATNSAARCYSWQGLTSESSSILRGGKSTLCSYCVRRLPYASPMAASYRHAVLDETAPGSLLQGRAKAGAAWDAFLYFVSYHMYSNTLPGICNRTDGDATPDVCALERTHRERGRTLEGLLKG